MRNRESKIDSFSILLTILLGFDSGFNSKKKSKIGQRTGIGMEKESDTTQHYFVLKVQFGNQFEFHISNRVLW